MTVSDRVTVMVIGSANHLIKNIANQTRNPLDDLSQWLAYWCQSDRTGLERCKNFASPLSRASQADEFWGPTVMSAIGGKADIGATLPNVCF